MEDLPWRPFDRLSPTKGESVELRNVGHVDIGWARLGEYFFLVYCPH